jgi:sugar (pentulose or hexulose) kinase
VINGKTLDAISCLFRILWMREHEPELFARTAKWNRRLAEFARRP